MKKSLRYAIPLIAAILFLFGGAAYCRIRFPIKYKSEIKYFSDKYGIEENLVFAVIKAESGFNPNKVSEKGATGRMQIMPETAEYNAGEGNVKLWKNEKGAPLTEKDIPFPETKSYVKRVISYRKIYAVFNR